MRTSLHRYLLACLPCLLSCDAAPESPPPVAAEAEPSSDPLTKLVQTPPSVPQRKPRVPTRENELPPAAKAFAEPNNALAFALYDTIEEKAPNFLFSPSSIEFALSMTAKGARGKTQTSMLQAMGISDWEAFASSLAPLQQYWQGAEGVELRIGNRLYLHDGYGFNPDFVEWNRERFAAEPVTVNFATQTEAARQKVNEFIASATKSKIPEFLPRGRLDKMTRILLANALYFRGDWADPFAPRSTHEREFHLSSGETVPTMMMFNKGVYGHALADDLQIVELDYAGRQFVLTVVMPTDATTFAEFEDSLTPKRWSELLAELKTTKIMLQFPRFEVDASQLLLLRKPLTTLGMGEAFDARADFGPMLDPPTRRDLALEEVYHRATITVDEHGSEAAAATVVKAVKKGISKRKIPVVSIDRPFVYALRDSHSGAILFLGRYTDPRG